MEEKRAPKAQSHPLAVVQRNWKTAACAIFVFLGFFLGNWAVSPSPLSNLTDKEDKFIHITDSEDVAEHLRALGLTPHHSVEYLSPNELPNSNGVYPLVSRQLHGRFLHITDMHPDELNVVGGAIRKQCHKKSNTGVTDEESISHKYGDALSGCDSPMGLYSDTLNWVRENLKDHIDFVIWTGDNIRHDNDRTHPRFEAEIFDMNEKVANDMAETFMDDGEEDLLPMERRVKVVPSLGNNDVYPHNLFAPGPTLQTREMFKIWRDFIPSEQMHTFDRGAYFLREVIPDELVVISINTLYWFTKNPLNDNCDARKQPGYKLFLWFGATLRECRKRNVKVWLSGHVPPIPNNIHNSCYAKIGVWLHEYSDVIIGGVWGHMNLDHWIPIDGVQSWKSINARLTAMGDSNINTSINKPWMESIDWNDESSVEDIYLQLGLIDSEGSLEFDKLPFTQKNLFKMDDFDEDNVIPMTDSDRYLGAPSGKVSYLEDIRDEMYASLKGRKKSGENFERYSIAHISASVIPTYNPGMRVWEYNVEDLLKSNKMKGKSSYFDYFRNLIKSNEVGDDSGYIGWNEFFRTLELELSEEDELDKLVSSLERDYSLESDNASLKDKISHYYTSKVDKTIPKPQPDGVELGPGYVMQALSPQRYTQYFIDLDEVNYGGDKKGEEGGQESKGFGYNIQYSTDDETYQMESLLVSDWINLGRKLGKSSPAPEKGKKKGKKGKNGNEKANKLWNSYIHRAFLSCNYEDLEGSSK